MTFQNTALREPVPDMVSTLGPWGSTDAPNVAISPTSATWEGVNRTVYFPIYVPTKCTLQRFWWANGSTVNAGATYAMAIYSNVDFKPSVRLATQSAAQGTASEIQFVTPAAPKVLGPDLYWLGISGTSVTTTHVFGHGMTASMIPLMKFTQASVNCPTTATPAMTSNTTLWVCGFSTTTTP